MEEFSFFITACILNEKQNFILNECIKNIRKNFANINYPIYIIDDIKDNETNYINISSEYKQNIHILKSEFKQAGEPLFLYYYHKLRPSKKAIYVHDTFLITKPIKKDILENITNIKFLLEFNSDIHLKEQYDFLNKLNKKDELIKLSKSFEWVGCFGGCCIITIDYLDHLQNKYNILNIIDSFKTRQDRYSYEIILGIIVCHDLNTMTNLSIYGDFEENYIKYNYAHVNYEHYLNNGNLPFYKIHFDR